MSNYPNQLDDDVSLPRVDDDVTQEGGPAINAIRDAIFGLEGQVGVGAQGTAASIAARLGVSLSPAGNLLPSAIAGLGLVTLPITDIQISPTAAIQESKLALAYPTATLYSIMNNINTGVDSALNFITYHGSKLEPHLAGVTYRHTMDQIDINANAANYFENRNGLDRNNTNLYTLFNDINNDLVAHEKADSTVLGPNPALTTVGTIPPTNYAHVSTGLFVDTSNFSFIPQTSTSVQEVLQFIDNSNILILGTRIQTLYQNGISRASRSTVVTNNLELIDGQLVTNSTTGQLIVPSTTVTTYHLDGGSSTPVDNISDGDDIVQFFPPASNATTNVFDSQFSAVKVGDILTVTYSANVAVTFLIKEVKYVVSSGPNPTKTYMVRIGRKNLFETTTATATITRSLVNYDKYGVLAVAQAQPPAPINNSLSSLIVAAPRGGEVLGIGFNPDLLDSSHFNLYLVLYPDGNPADGIYNLAPIDVTGNQGATPGLYTLDTIVAAVNAAFRTPGYNYRFIAYQYQGNFGVMLSDPFGGASFSLISGIIGVDGLYDQGLSNTVYPSNVVDIFTPKDALGFGTLGADVASPPYQATFANAQIAQTPTQIFVPLTRKTFYVNGVERERLNTEPNQLIDGYGDGYWPATILSSQVIGPRVRVTYQVNYDLSASSLGIGKTVTVQSESGSGTPVDFGRFFIENIQFNDCDCDGYGIYTQIVVYDGIHGTGVTPYVSSPAGTVVRLYGNGDSVGFSIENASDGATPSPTSSFKRHFEVYADEDGYTFTHERGRMNISGATTTVNSVVLYSSPAMSYINLYKISPKLKGYIYGQVTKLNLQITSYVPTTGIYSGYLCAWDGSSVTHQGPTIVGKKGQVVRFYDETNIDYIDFIFTGTDGVPAISSTQNIDIQLFSTLSLDDQVVLLSTVQVNDSTKQLAYLRDARQFGNVSEKQLSTSALDYIAAPTRFLNENGVIQGFNITQFPNGSSPYLNTLTIDGGVAVVNGKIVQMNNETIAIPVVQEVLSTNATINTINWFVCVNDRGEFELVASTDYDPNGSFASLYAAAAVDHTRMFTVQNPNVVTPTPYIIRGDYLADIVQNQRDLTIIATVSIGITLVASTYVITSVGVFDARRYVYNGYGGLSEPFILGNNASFQSFTALNTWLTNLTAYKSSLYTDPATSSIYPGGNSVGRKVIVKGNFTFNNVALNYLQPVTFEGDGGTFITSTDAGAYNIGPGNVTFKNLTFDYLFNGTGDGGFNTAYLAQPNTDRGVIVVVGGGTVSNIVIDNCTFTTAQQYHYPFIVFQSVNTNSIFENISITNCKFLSTYAGDDKQAVISFTAPLLAPGAGVLQGSRLDNVLIANNYCNKNQMIIASSQIYTGTSQVQDMLVGVNFKIQNNVCGCINVMVRQDVPTNTYNTTTILDKTNGTIISGNTCKFICSGYATGLMIDANNNRPFNNSTPLVANGIFSGYLTITDNVTSFIHTGLRISSTIGASLNPTLIIKNNKLTAYDYSIVSGFLNAYYTNGTAYIYPTYTQTGTALIVDKVTGS